MSGEQTPFSVAAAVLAYVDQALCEAGREPGAKMVAAGGLVVEDCCDGLLIVAPERIYRTVEPFPTEALADAVCGDYPIAVALVVSVLRCTPTMDDKGRAPSIASQEAALCDLLADGAVVWKALRDRGLLGDDGSGFPDWERAALSQTYFGGEGACVGVETRVTVGIEQSSWCIT